MADTRRALELLVARLDAADEVFFAAFNDTVAAASWTQDHLGVLREFDALRPGGGSALLDAVPLILPIFELGRQWPLPAGRRGEPIPAQGAVADHRWERCAYAGCRAVLAFESGPGDGKYHGISVRLKDRRLRVRARAGCVAPSAPTK